MKFEAAIYFTYPFHFDPLSNLSFKKCNWMLIWVKKESIIQKKVQGLN